MSICTTQLDGRSKVVLQGLPDDGKRLMELDREKGSSAWLSAHPLREHGLVLNKQAFCDALCFRFGWRPPLLPFVGMALWWSML